MGTGLGLAICRRLVEGMRGEIGVSSPPDRGSRFWFRLPLIEIRPGAADAVPGGFRKSATADQKFQVSMNILLADDDEISRMLLQRFIHSYAAESGLHIDSVENGRLAFEFFMNHGERVYDIVLLDMQMPELNGLETVRAIRAFEATSGRNPTPLIAVTANAMQADIERARQAGFDDFVSKPVDRTELHRVIFSQLLAFRDIRD